MLNGKVEWSVAGDIASLDVGSIAQLGDNILGACRFEPLLGTQIRTALLGLPLLELREVSLQFV